MVMKARDAFEPGAECGIEANAGNTWRASRIRGLPYRHADPGWHGLYAQEYHVSATCANA